MINYKYYNYFNKFFLLIVLLLNNVFINNNNSSKFNTTNIPELYYNNNQTIHLLIPPKKCHLTLFFFSDYKKNNNSVKIKRIKFIDKNYFITFYESDNDYRDYYAILQKQGLIKSKYKLGKHNLFFSQINNNSLAQNYNNNYDLNKYQKVFRYLNGYKVFYKNTLYELYMEMKKLFSDDFDYMPETYNYPEQKNLIYNKFQNYKFNSNDLWMIKPSNLCAGSGITIFRSLQNVKLKEFVLTKYMTNIHLINGKKYDLRLYILISGLKPLRIYFYKEGLVRIAAEKFCLKENSLDNKFIHLTGININIKNKNFISPNSTKDENANVWNILMYQNYLKKLNIKWVDIREKIKDLIIKSIISAYKKINEKNERENVSDQSFFNLLGFDIIITNKFEPKLLEINEDPFMRYRFALEKPDKVNIFIDTLNLIGIVPFSRRNEEPFNFKFLNRNIPDDNINNALCELQRPMGDYELIFPTKENIYKYKKYFIYNTEENTKFWEIIIDK